PTRWPASNSRNSSCGVSPVLLGQHLLRLKHGLCDALVGSTTAEIAAHAFPDTLGIVTGMSFVDESDRAHYLPRRAEAALEAVMGNEGGLHRMERIAVGEAFDR